MVARFPFLWLSLVLSLALHLAAHAQAPSVTYAAPITITKGGTYTGNYRSLQSGVACISVYTNEPVIIENCVLAGAGNLIVAGGGADLIVRNCKGYGLTPSVDNTPRGRFVDAYQAKRLTVENNYLEQTSGILANRWSGNGTANQTLTIRYNKGLNCDGRYRNGNGKDFRSFVQLNTVAQLANVEISYNEFINRPNESAVEDNINLYNSSGTSQSPIRVHNNYVQGAYPYPANGSSFTGTGMTTDGDGFTFLTMAGNVEAYENQFISTCNAAMNIASGHDVYYHDNRMVTSGLLPDGSRLNSTWAGTAIFNYYQLPFNLFVNNRISNNTIGYVRWGSNSPYTNRQDLSPGACATCPNNTSLPNTVTLATEQNELTLWQQKIQQNNITVGVLGSGTNNPTGGNSPTGGTTATPVGTNLVTNPSFDADGTGTQTPQGWSVWTGSGTQTYASYTENWPAGRTGAYHGTHYRPETYEVYTYQTINNLTPGKYTLKAWVKSSGGQGALRAKNYGGSQLEATSSPTLLGPVGPWQQLVINDIQVSNGQCEIGLYSKANILSQWFYYDDVELVRQADAVVIPAPTVSLSAGGGTATVGTALGLTATAAAGTGATLSKVEFYLGDTKLGEATSAPYQLSWTPTAAGSASLTARAIDNGGQSTSSAAVSVTVSAAPAGPAAGTNLVVNPSFEVDRTQTNTPTGWSKSGPSPGASYAETNGGGRTGSYHGTHYSGGNYEVYTYQSFENLARGQYTVRAWVKSSGGQSAVQLQVKGFGGQARTLDIAGNSGGVYGQWQPVVITDIQVNNGKCELGFYSKAGAGGQALFFDDVELVATSSGGTTIPAPTVSLSAGGGTATVGTALGLTATAAAGTGATLSKVEFYLGDTKLGEATSAPYQLSWTPTAAGSASLTARAIDNGGQSTSSAAVSVTVSAAPAGPAAGTNLVVNPSFEVDRTQTNTPTGWSKSGPSPGASYAETNGGGRTGSYHGTHYSGGSYEVYTYQSFENLARGQYTVRAWVKSSGGQSAVQLQVKGFGGQARTLDIAGNSGGVYGQWQPVVITDIQISNGKCELGFYSKAGAGGQALFFDDVELVATGSGNRASNAGLITTFTMYPNPAVEAVKVELTAAEAGAATVEVISLQNQQRVAATTQNVTAGTSTLTIETGSIPNGTYLLQVQQNGISQQQRLVISH